LECFDRIPPAEHGDRDHEQSELLGALLRAQIRAGAVHAARATRSAAVAVAERTGRRELLIAAFAAWTEPTPWQTHSVGVVDERIVAHLSRLLGRDDLRPAVRCHLLAVYSDEVSGESGRSSLEAARAAVTMAEGLDDPRLRALTVATLTRELPRGELEEFTRLSEELVELGTKHDLPAFRWSGVFNLARAAARRNEATATRRLVTEALGLARAYRLPEPTGVSECALAASAHTEGDPEEALLRYLAATEGMRSRGSLHSELLMFHARATVLATQGRLAELAPYAEDLAQRHGAVAVDIVGAALAAAGRHDEARRILKLAAPLPHPLFFTFFATFRAQTVIALGDRDGARRLYEAMVSYRDGPPAGLENLVLSVPPVAYTLGTLAVLLGHHHQATGHFTSAISIAERWNAPLWAAQARAALHQNGRARA
jgi:tetratricopeptide (TPR) repeat protein